MTAESRWWCPICRQILKPDWLGHRHTVAYHAFGQPPFVARHGLVPARSPASASAPAPAPAPAPASTATPSSQP